MKKYKVCWENILHGATGESKFLFENKADAEYYAKCFSANNEWIDCWVEEVEIIEKPKAITGDEHYYKINPSLIVD